MKIKNFKLNPKAVKIIATGIIVTGLVAGTLTGCGNKDMFDTQYTFNKAVIIEGSVATIVEVKKWNDYDGEQLQIETKDGLVFLVHSENIYPMDIRNTDITEEEFARALVGENGEVSYLGSSDVNKTK